MRYLLNITSYHASSCVAINAVHAHRYWSSNFQLWTPYHLFAKVHKMSESEKRTKFSMFGQDSTIKILIRLTVQIAIIFVIVSQEFRGTPLQSPHERCRDDFTSL